MATSVRLIESVPKVGRVARNPQHSFSLRVLPWQIQPMMIAPVLPGETMKNLLLQSRIVSKPIKSPLVGWWAEYYFFYVKHRDLTGQSSLLQEMHLTPGYDVSSLKSSSASVWDYNYSGGMKYVQFCLQRVVEEYFRDEEDGAWNANAIDSVPLAQVNKPGPFESIRDGDAAAVTADHEMPGEVTPMPYGVDTAWSTYYAQYEHMRALKLTDATFEDYLKQFGVKTPEVQEKENRPELLRYIREWTYPTNTVEPTTGAPSTALSWSISERADKDRFFQEPGFIFGVQVIRPKIYLKKQKGGVIGGLDDAFAWLPPAVIDQAWTSLKNYAFDQGPLPGIDATGSYWLDLRDLFVFGDQYINYDDQYFGDGNVVDLPLANYKLRYATEAIAQGLFKTAGDRIASDGVVSLRILGRIVNQT